MAALKNETSTVILRSKALIVILRSKALTVILRSKTLTVILRSKTLIVILSEQSERENLFNNKKYGKHITTTKDRIPDPRNQRT